MNMTLNRTRWIWPALLLAILVCTTFTLANLLQASERPPSIEEQAASRPQMPEYNTRPDGIVGSNPECVGPNVLDNGSFEGQYSSWIPPDGHPDCPAGICTTAQMAPDWTPFWRSHDPGDPPWIIVNPEYKPAESVFVNPPRVRTGDRAQQYFSFFTTHEAGLLQTQAVVPGAEYCFSIWGHSWSAEDDDDAFSGPDTGVLLQRIGIDPTGNDDWQSGSIQWGQLWEIPDFYEAFMIRGVATSPELTVYAYSQPTWAVKHNDVYWDDASLVRVQLKPDATIVFLEETGQQGASSQSFPVNLWGPSDLSWSAVVQPGGNIPGLSLSSNNGAAGSDTTININSSATAPGVYTATIVITASEAIHGSPATVDVVLTITDDIDGEYLPVITNK